MAVVALVLMIGLALIAAPAVGAQAQDVYSEKTLEISRKLQCPVCDGQTVAESNSPIARQMRDAIEQKVQAGESEDAIINFFVARYGESVVTEPPKSGFSLGLWWMPVVVVALGATVVAMFVRERTRSVAAPVRSTAGSGSQANDDELEAIAREVLGTPGDERMSRA
jgi:cytochrome c-type biogenesis protein CcmH